MTALLAGVGGWLAVLGGGAPSSDWTGPALMILVAAAVLAAVGGMGEAPVAAWPGWLFGAAALALTMLAYASLAWTPSPTITFQAASRWLFIALVVGVCAWMLRGARLPALGLIGAGIVSTIGALAAIVALLLGDEAALSGDRLAFPINYANGQAALMALSIPGAVLLAGSRQLPLLVRAGLAGVGGLLAATTLLTLSRGAIGALIIALLIGIVVTPQRFRVMAMAIAVIAAVAVASPLLLADGTSSGALVSRGVGTLLAFVVAAGLAGALVGMERRLPRAPWRRVPRPARASIAILGCVAVVGGLVAAGLSEPVQRSLQSTTERSKGAGSERLASAQSNRFDYWQVAIDEASPRGLGAGTFPIAWFRERSIDENVADVHGWPFALGFELGVGGLVLGLAMLVALVWAARRVRTTLLGPPLAAGVAYVVVHSSVDWLYALPAVAIGGALMTGALLGSAAKEPSSAGGWGIRSAAVAAGLLALMVLLPLWRSSSHLAAAEREPVLERALGETEVARRWSPWSIEPLQLITDLRLEAGDPAGAEGAALQATDMEPQRWEAWAQLADARLALGDLAGAQAAWSMVDELNPRVAARQEGL